MIMTNFKLNLKGQFNNSQTAVNPTEVGPATVNRQSRLMSVLCLLALLTLGVGQMWGARKFNSGEVIYFKDATLSNLGNNTWKVNETGATICAYFYGDGDAWVNCTTIESGEWNTTGAIYKFTVPNSNKKYTGVIFTRGKNTDSWTNVWNQTTDQTPDDSYNIFYISNTKSGDKYTGTWGRYSPNGAVVGDFNSWNPDANPFSSGSTSTINVSLSSSSNTSFKILYKEAYYGNTGTITNSVSNWVFETSKDNCTITPAFASSAQNYSFKWENSTKKISVTYPTSYTITYGVGTNKGCSSVSVSPSFTSGRLVVASESITFSKTATNSGYSWKGWYNAAGGSGTNWQSTDANYTSSSRTGNVNVYACYDLINYNITYNLNGGSGASNSTYNVTTSTITLPTAPTVNKTGYTFGGWFIESDFSGARQTQITKGSTGNKAYYAKWDVIWYTITYELNGGSKEGIVPWNPDTYSVEQNVTINVAPTKEGYDFDGWYTNDALTTPVGSPYAISIGSTGNKTFYAKWTPKTTTITYSQSGTGYGSGGPSTTQTATYAAAMPSITIPTAATGYAFMGYYDALEPLGTQYYTETGASARTWDKVDATATLYAYFKKAEITALALSSTVVAPGTEVTATPTIEPTPTPTTIVCWKILRDNGNLLTDEGFTSAGGNAVTFSAPATGGTYRVVCTLRTGTSCAGGTVLDTRETNLVVASAHTVTIRYQDSDGRTLAPSTEIAGRPLDWSEVINPPAVIGYTFTRWNAGDGITISTDKSAEVSTTTTAAIYMKANYDGTLTAVYSKKNMLYFNNTLGWEHVYVYFYKDGNYWSNDHNNSGSAAENVYGSGTNTSSFSGSYKNQHGEMTRIEGTNIFYFDYQAAGFAHTNYITFAKDNQHNYNYFDDTEVVRLADANHYFDKPGTMPMYVPLTTKYEIRNKHDESYTKYYTEGYWMNYPENTGYTLHIYSGTAAGVTDELQSIAFPFTADKTMPMEVTLELNANTTYGYEIHRADGSYYGNSGTLKINASGDEGETPVKLAASTRGGIKTSAAGDYTFKLNFGESSGYGYLFGVHYPASVGSYRLVYTDLATWSQGTAHTATWSHPSRVIYKNEGAADTVSFFVAKGNSPKIQIQKITSINSEGAITWENVGDAVSYDDVSKAGVYNFITSQTADALTIAKVEPYTGNYYIRTGAVDGGWDNYRTGSDHLMTYSAFSEDRAQNTFGELFSHYKAKWCPRGTNVVFCIANDYSSCISDTLWQDIGNPYNNIYPANDPYRPGELKAESYSGTTITSGETTDKYSANIRFMWNRSTNKISRAYVSSSTNATKKFLILKGGDTFWNSGGSDLSGTGESHANKEAIFKDNENWIYEREIKVTTGTKFKLFACYAETTPSEANAQYFRGHYADGAWTDGNYSILIDGNGSGTCNARLIYDFKTNRLIAAYLPDGSDVSGTTEINADLMIIREHQGAGLQITFANSSSELDKVKTVYGVMRFNRWILNNRQYPEDHDKEHSKTDDLISTHHPLLDAGSQKSVSERSLFWISFPFDVNLSEVFGFGTYGTHWVMMRYNGEERAKQGFWADSEGFWEYIWDRNGVVLEGGMGYVLALDIDLMQATDRNFWSNDIQQVELFFPSTSAAGTIKQTTATVTVPSYQCNIDRTGNNGPDINKNRTKVDSHWNIIGVPSYANYGTELTDENGTVTWKDNSALNWTNDLPFLYEWNANDNTYTVQSGSNYPFKAMHAYYVQYHGTLNWSLASATPSPSPIVARRAYADAPQSEEFRLEILRNDKMEDQTFVKLSNDEEVSANFAFEEDITKEKNAGKANIYTIVENYIPVAGNTLPMTEQTTVVPVGVTIKNAGEYTFAMPEGTNGVGVTLVDTEANVRTSLSALDYTVNLEAGEYTGRFVLEISPIQNTPTDIEAVSVQPSEVRKVMIDGILYIVKDGKMYDARGARVE